MKASNWETLQITVTMCKNFVEDRCIRTYHIKQEVSERDKTVKWPEILNKS